MVGIIVSFIFFTYIGISYFVVSRIKNKRHKYIAIAVLVLIPTWDIIIGRAMFYGLCLTQGGIHVYQTVDLGPEYFDKEGVPLFFDRKKSLKEMRLDEYVGLNDYGFSSKFFNVKKDVDMIVNKENNEIKGDVTYFVFFGGWVFNALNTGGADGERCPAFKLPSKYIIDLSKEVFVHKNL